MSEESVQGQGERHPQNVAFHDLPAEKFPFKVEFLSDETGDVVRSFDMQGPGALRVPGRDELGEPVRVRLSFADGEVIESPNAM